LEEQKKSRDAVVSDVKMATKLIEHMDTALFLARDIQSLKPTAQSLLQLASTKHEEKYLGIAPYSLLQEADTSSMGLQQLIESYSASMGTSEGPFDKVTRMISGLIASLKAEANDAVNQNQFCQDSLGENRNDRVEKQADIDSLVATIRWSEMAIVRLTDDVDYLKGEKQHMVDLEDKAKKALTKETSRVDRELHEHGLGYQVVTKAVEVLTQLCDLGSSASSFIQHDSDLHTSEISTMQGRNSKAVSRLEQCKEAADLLTSGAKELKKLDGITNDYISEYKSMSDGVKDHAKKAQDAVSSQLKSTISAKAQRASELATANKEIKKSKKDLVLIETAKKQLEHQCSHVETREEKMARRQDEIDALKEALNVLDGESVAVA
jgi:chromosome segregation ATPase